MWSIIIACWILYLLCGAAWLMIYPMLTGENLEGGFFLFLLWPLHLFLVALAFILMGERRTWRRS